MVVVTGVPTVITGVETVVIEPGIETLGTWTPGMVLG